MHVALEKMENTSRRERVPGTFLGPGRMPPDHAAAREAEDAGEALWSGASGPRCSPLACRPRQDETLAGLGRWRRGQAGTAAAFLSQRGRGPPGSSESACEGRDFSCREVAPSVSSAARTHQQWLKHPLVFPQESMRCVVGAGVKPCPRLCGGA